MTVPTAAHHDVVKAGDKEDDAGTVVLGMKPVLIYYTYEFVQSRQSSSVLLYLLSAICKSLRAQRFPNALMHSRSHRMQLGAEGLACQPASFLIVLFDKRR